MNSDIENAVCDLRHHINALQVLIEDAHSQIEGSAERSGCLGGEHCANQLRTALHFLVTMNPLVDSIETAAMDDAGELRQALQFDTKRLVA